MQCNLPLLIQSTIVLHYDKPLTNNKILQKALVYADKDNDRKLNVITITSISILLVFLEKSNNTDVFLKITLYKLFKIRTCNGWLYS
jgi:hypothetical protein